MTPRDFFRAWSAALRRIVAVSAGAGAVIVGAGAAETGRAMNVLCWEPIDLPFQSSAAHDWWEFPVRAVFTHATSGERVVVEGFCDTGNRWVVRFAAPRSGEWSYRTESADRALNGHAGRLMASGPSAEDVARNANLRGAIRVARSGRHFEFADGTPFFLLADTIWAVNTARCGLGESNDGPFFRYLADRKAKGFTAILMAYFHGYGDYPESPGHRNEGGYPFFERDPARLNPEHFRALDRRMRALWANGLVAAVNTTWWGKTRRCLFKPEDARRISAYCAVRYGAFNALWGVAGEYQYNFGDCGWTPADVSALGATLQAHNPWHRPVSVHPSARLDWPAPHNVQSSRPFHGEPWLDHHWLQTGQSRDRLFNIVSRLRENRALAPATPVFLSEAFYESSQDPESAYHMRWQVWAAWLNGAAGFGYGADGIWQFFDPSDATGEKGKDVKGTGPWQEALVRPGSAQLVHAKTFLAPLEWWTLEPQRERIRVNGAANPLPTPSDLTSPHVATIGDRTLVAYLPRGNGRRELELTLPADHKWSARWFDPRNGGFRDGSTNVAGGTTWRIPARPNPENEDWVLLLTNAR